MTTAAGISRPTSGLVLFGLLAFVVGFVGQGSWGIGARAAPSAVTAVVTDVTGGAGNQRPVRVQIALAVTNHGQDEVRVHAPLTAGSATRVLALTPSALLVKPGETGQIDADVVLDCDVIQPLRLPDLELEQVDGRSRPIEISGSGPILEACARAVAEVRPLAVTVSPKQTDGRHWSVVLSAPTGRRLDITAIRAGGVPLLTPASPVTVSGPDQVAVRLTAPPTCPVQWLVAGMPSALAVDLVPGTDAGATLRVRVGPALTRWLLDTVCPRSR
jgi:hypothetical protein